MVRRVGTFEATVDSGSPRCYFHANIGEALGIDIKSGQKEDLGGVVGSFSEAFCHKVNLVVLGNIVSIIAAFSYTLTVAGILGRHGFFDNFRCHL